MLILALCMLVVGGPYPDAADLDMTGAVISAAFAMLAVSLITGVLLFGLTDPDKALETVNREPGKTDKIAFALLWEVNEAI